MGLLQKIIGSRRPRSPEEERLDAITFAVGMAMANTAAGLMPPDYLDEVISAPGFAEAFRGVADQQGAEKATALARRSIFDYATGGYIGAHIPRDGLDERVDAVLAHLLATV